MMTLYQEVCMDIGAIGLAVLFGLLSLNADGGRPCPAPRRRVRYCVAQEKAAAIASNSAPGTVWWECWRLAPEWRAGMRVKAGDPVRRNGSIYACVQAHVTQADWPPEAVPALWRLLRVPGEGAIPEWRQPAGAHDAYAAGARVRHNGFVWRSVADHNVWEPGVYGWEKEQ